MSVMIARNEDIIAITQFARHFNISFWFRNQYYTVKSDNDAELIATRLMNANIKSYNYRYGDNPISLIEQFNYKWSAKHWTTGISLYKICDFLEYQCSEIPMWQGSIEKAFLDAIRAETIQRTEEYQHALWGF